ncbi:glycosyltransferase family 39 protein [Thermicanus aegyptius]|uniref:glycosyltransferase family 39 protein n=1 Tax=Thermicanus aegyptius TaxID=94009 RepID=UPI00048C6863|nr:glycosyltransferase family 39 protein [Thermicanus aegyptius]
MKKIAANLYKSSMFVTVVLLLYALLLAIFVRTPGLVNYPAYLISIASFFVIFSLVLSVRFLWNRSVNDVLFMILLMIAVLLPRALWIMFVDTKPFSDFDLYHQYALNASLGKFHLWDKTVLVFPHRIGFPLLLSFFYKIFGGSLLTARILNLFFSFLSAVLLYLIGNEIFQKKVGQIAALLFSLWPSQIMYNSVIASEHIFIFFFLFSLYFYILAIKKQMRSLKAIYFALSALFLSISQFIRPIALMLIPIFFLSILFLSTQPGWRRRILHGIKVVSFMTVVFLLFFGIFCYIAYQLTGINMFKSSSGYNLLVGTNVKSNGVYNDEDARILEEFHYDFDTVHHEAQKRAIHRVLSSPLNFMRLLEKKYAIMWGDDSYGAGWSLHDISHPNKISNKLVHHKLSLIVLSQCYYIAVLFFALFGSLFALKEINFYGLPILLVFWIHVVAYSFLEVQSRYHYPAIILLLILSAYGLVKISEEKEICLPDRYLMNKSG